MEVSQKVKSIYFLIRSDPSDSNRIVRTLDSGDHRKRARTRQAIGRLPALCKLDGTFRLSCTKKPWPKVPGILKGGG